jgi:hypothetical protein
MGEFQKHRNGNEDQKPTEQIFRRKDFFQHNQFLFVWWNCAPIIGTRQELVNRAAYALCQAVFVC